MSHMTGSAVLLIVATLLDHGLCARLNTYDSNDSAAGNGETLAQECADFCFAEICNDPDFQGMCTDCSFCNGGGLNQGHVETSTEQCPGFCIPGSCNDPDFQGMCSGCPFCSSSSGIKQELIRPLAYSAPTPFHGLPKDPCNSGIVHGIGNSGNDCFLSSMMQLVLNSPTVCEIVTDYQRVLDNARNPLPAVKEWIVKYYSSTAMSSTDHSQFRRQLQGLGVVYSPNDQEDASEAFMNLLGLYTQVPHESGHSVVTPVREFRRFHKHDIQFETSTTKTEGIEAKCSNKICETNGVTERRPMLSLPVPEGNSFFHRMQHHTLTKLYQAFTAPEKSTGGETFKAQVESDIAGVGTMVGEVGKFEVIKEVASLPSELFVHIMRFAFDMRSLETVKINTPVDAPAVWKHPELGRDYTLVGFIMHHGSSAGAGHYTAFRKMQEGWLEANDSNVYPVTEKEALQRARTALVLQYRAM